MSMENFRFKELLIEQMKRESSKLCKEVYPEFKESKLSKEAKGFLADDLILTRIYNNVSSVYENYAEEKYLISVLEKMYDSVSFEYYRDNKLLYLTIPIFERLLNSKNLGTVSIANNLFFKLYCAFDNNSLFSDENMTMAKEFDFKEVCSVEHLMTTKGSDLSVKNIINFLNFVNFERKKKQIDNYDRSAYMQKLDELYNKLYRYFSFVGLDETVLKFDKIKDSDECGVDFYNKNELIYNNSNIKLVQFYYGDGFSSYINRYFSFLEMENKMMNVKGEEQRKNMLLASFCYSSFCKNEFFKSFADVSLTIDDLVKFVKKYEEAGYEFSEKQANMLLRSFTKKYILDLSLEDEYEESINLIRSSYKSFYEENFAFSDFEFIDYFNSLFDKDFSTFDFSDCESGRKLDYYILKAVLEDGYIGFDGLKGTKLYEKFIDIGSDKDVDRLMEEEEAKKQYRLNIFNKVYPLVSSYSDALVTVEYFLRKNVDIGEEGIAKEVFNWCGVDNLYDVDDLVIDNTIECVKRDFHEELFSTPYDKRSEVFERYKEYIQYDGISNKFGEKSLCRFYREQVSSYCSLIIDGVIDAAKDAYDKGANIFEVVSNYNIGKQDFRLMVLKVGEDFSLYEQYKRDEEAFLMSSSNTVNSEVEQAVTDTLTKSNNFRKCSITIDNKDEILSSMQNEIVKPNGEVRKYTYFDLLMQVGGDLSPKEAWSILFNNYDGNKDIVAKTFKQFFDSIPKHYSIINLHNEPPFVEHIRGQRHIIKVDGSDHLVTDNERECVVDFIQRNNFPMYVYYDAIKAYLNGEFDPSKPLVNHIKPIDNLATFDKVMVKTDKKN